MNTTTTERIINDIQDYTHLGLGIINNYTKIFTTTDGIESWNTGRLKTYSFTVKGIESKKYQYRGSAVSAMIKACR